MFKSILITTIAAVCFLGCGLGNKATITVYNHNDRYVCDYVFVYDDDGLVGAVRKGEERDFSVVGDEVTFEWSPDCSRWRTITEDIEDGKKYSIGLN